MLIEITEMDGIDARRLMDVYSESNYENTGYFFPEESDKQLAVKKVEAGFLDYLRNEFYSNEGNSYMVLEEGGEWVSALRLNKIKPGLYYIEALETRPDCRRKGFGAKLLNSVKELLKARGSFLLCDCVSKSNAPSVDVHLKCGFRIMPGPAHDLLSDEYSDGEYGFEYAYAGIGDNTGIRLEPMTRERFHELFNGFQYDPCTFADMELYERCRLAPYSEERTDARFDSRVSRPDTMTFAIMLGSTVIGEVVLKHIDREAGQCELGIHLKDDSVKGLGFGTEAERLAIGYAFEELGLNKVLADCLLKNTRSAHVIEKLGFRKTGEENGFAYYELKRQEWEPSLTD